jgi:ankyrin repeat protein
LKFHHFAENFNTQSLLHKMNDDNAKKLIDAIDKNDTATASSLISSGSVNLNGKPWPLHYAARQGRVEIMAMLLDAGADINAVDRFQQFVCRVAIVENHFDALKLLVERGADLGVVDSDRRSLLATVAIYERDERYVILLLEAGAPLDGLSNGELMWLVKTVTVFNRLLARGVNFTTMRDDLGCSLCHYVARSVTCENDLRFLVNVCGNDAVHAVDNLGRTSLHWASSSGNGSGVRALVELGADIDRQGHRSRSALINAAENVQSSCIELLLVLGADVDVGSNDGMTACHHAALWRKPLCVLLLRQEAILISLTTMVKLLE